MQTILYVLQYFKSLIKLKNGYLVILFFWACIFSALQVLSNFGILNPNFISSPSEILNSFIQIKFWQIFLVDFISSFNRIIISLILAFTLSYFLVFLCLLNNLVKKLLSNLQSLVKYIPAPVLIPIAILFFGIGETTKIAVIFFTVLVLHFNFLLDIIEKDEKRFETLQKSWKIKTFSRFINFFLPISIYLSYRIIPAIVIWSFSIAVITELILGGQTGLGIRIIQFQQLYNTSYLYAYLVLIILTAFLTEFFLINLSSRFKWDALKYISAIVVSICIVLSLIFSFNSLGFFHVGSSSLKILTYKAAANLPLLVYKEKFNEDLPIEIENVGSGLQVMDAILSKKVYAGGFSDMPNVLSGISKDQDLKILSQVVEQPDHPSLFFISKTGNFDDLSGLNYSQIGYFPNNIIIKQGLDFVLFSKKVRTASVEYISSSDPNSLVQGYTSDKIQGILTIEPFAADIEKQTGQKRLNPKDTFVKGQNFKNLPLAGLVVNTKLLTAEKLDKFSLNIQKSIDFIRSNMDKNYHAIGELKTILEKNSINSDSSLSAYQSGDEINPEDLSTLLNYAKLYQVEGTEKLEQKDVKDFYKLTKTTNN